MTGNSRTADIQLGGHSDFLEFGGDSLLAPQTLSQIETVFGTSVSIRRFFSAPTAAQLVLDGHETPKTMLAHPRVGVGCATATWCRGSARDRWCGR